jgi:hypothetical protein
VVARLVGQVRPCFLLEPAVRQGWQRLDGTIDLRTGPLDKFTLARHPCMAIISLEGTLDSVFRRHLDESPL